MRTVKQPTSMDMDRARVAVRQHLKPTPLLAISNCEWLKLDSQQPTGAFKVRGAIASLSRLPRGARIVTASAGNHAIGIAWAADTLGHRATIVVPATASPRKLSILEEMGANVVRFGESYDAAEQHALDLAASGLTYVSAYNDPHVIAGQGTMLDEIADQISEDFTVFVPVGGGGLASGIALRAAAMTDRNIRVIGVETVASVAVSSAVRAGRTEEIPIYDSIADGLVGNLEAGSVTADILRELGTELVSVTEQQIEQAIRTMYFHHDLRAEGAGAVAFAAMKSMNISGAQVAIVSGRNIDEMLLKSILEIAE